ncbi:MAG: acyltransferase family protein [Pseudomonadota bacterium]
MTAVSTSRLYEIDLLRFLAALAVVFYHYSFRAFESHGLAIARWDAVGEFSRYGYLGVELFFMISGFVILLSAHDRSTTAFVRSRLVRLYPAYWLAVTLTALVLLAWGSGKFSVSFGQYLVNLTMLQKFFGVRHVDGVYWTLVVELKFYFLVWLLLRTGAMSQLRRWLWCWLGVAGLALLLPDGIADRLDSLLLAQWAPFFSIGIACFLLRGSSRHRSDWLLLLLATGLAGGIAAVDAAELSTNYRQPISPTVAVAIVIGFATIFAALALDWTHWLRWSWLAPLGDLTYPLYLLHAYIGYTLMQRLNNGEPEPALVLTLAVVMVVFAWLFHRYAEAPVAERLRVVLQRFRPATR